MGQVDCVRASPMTLMLLRLAGRPTSCGTVGRGTLSGAPRLASWRATMVFEPGREVQKAKIGES